MLHRINGFGQWQTIKRLFRPSKWRWMREGFLVNVLRLDSDSLTKEGSWISTASSHSRKASKTWIWPKIKSLLLLEISRTIFEQSRFHGDNESKEKELDGHHWLYFKSSLYGDSRPCIARSNHDFRPVFITCLQCKTLDIGPVNNSSWQFWDTKNRWWLSFSSVMPHIIAK